MIIISKLREKLQLVENRKHRESNRELTGKREGQREKDNKRAECYSIISVCMCVSMCVCVCVCLSGVTAAGGNKACYWPSVPNPRLNAA